jgi:thymidine kinase
MQQTGSIKIIIGCMFSGKTTELQREFREWDSINKTPLCINYIDDNRYGDIYTNMYSHDKVAVDCIKVKSLKDVEDELIKENDIILVNEGQFFSDLVEYCVLWCDTYHKKIIVCGLDGDFQRKPFGKILDLIPYADSVEKITAYCKNCSDGTKAIFTHRKSTEQEQVVIGVNNYEALCRKCYVMKNKFKNTCDKKDKIDRIDKKDKILSK